MMKNIETINFVYNKLCDEESKETFEAKLNYIISGESDEFCDWFLTKYKNIYCPELNKFEKEDQNKKYIIFGGGYEGRKTYKILKACNKKIVAWSDNNRNLWGKIIEGLPVIAPGKLMSKYQNEIIIIAARYSILEIYYQLLMLGFPRERILIPQTGSLFGVYGEQYFDLFSASDKEIFVDAGCFDGETSKKFVSWCGKKYEKIYAFEPDENCWENCERAFLDAQIKNVEFIRKAAWKKTDILSFQGVGAGASVVREKGCLYQVSAVSIDEVLKEDPVTFIKMDVEGSEKEALEGAGKCIKRYKPKLAVSVYHKPEDLWILGSYILKLNPEYKLYLRHYTTCNYETVLYAV